METLAATATAARGRRAPVPARSRPPRRDVHGVLLLDKPLGVSSNDALQQAKRLFRAVKAGHTGTLDPLASGLLPIAFGAATKFSHAALDADKAYRAVLRLGAVTATGDLEGEVRRMRPVAVARADVDAACRRFEGGIDQLPPMHSALKHEGRALYEYARAGVEIERAARRVVVHAIDVVAFDGDRLVLDVRCGKGTYVRTLAEDIGEALGCGAHLTALRRTASGRLALDAAHTLDALAGLDEAARDALLLPVDALLADWPVLRLDGEIETQRFLSGLPRRVDAADEPGVRVYGAVSRDAGATFLGSGRVAAGELTVIRLLSAAEAQAQAGGAVASIPGELSTLKE